MTTFARVITEVLAPGVLVAVLLLVVGFHAGSQPGVSRWWGAPAALFAAGIPMAYVVRGVRRGRLTSVHIPEREHRRGPLIFGMVSVAIGTAVLVALGAPRELLALLAAGITGLVVFALVTAFWKMSIHSGVAAGTVAVLVAIHGPVALIGVPVALLVGWSRLVLSAHTVAQVVAGTLVGALIAGTVFPVLR
ncbi:phosphoesterase PA-phosphatase [Actinoplanes sp. LDG1-06]|uniref:Phosphoesterase PA-phosphatase n=1 Tax=Paractinoplanes ovalisporus TaxID=2810368 RepID=A0ABS2A3E4_9ACTN|nr:phosphoesterase PA-phosphatase [Actinoplanes ovalisporus]MBM2614365.1 phosphoesterase PA-phosphatase [Actinoplanes ovalisporus]